MRKDRELKGDEIEVVVVVVSRERNRSDNARRQLELRSLQWSTRLELAWRRLKLGTCTKLQASIDALKARPYFGLKHSTGSSLRQKHVKVGIGRLQNNLPIRSVWGLLSSNIQGKTSQSWYLLPYVFRPNFKCLRPGILLTQPCFLLGTLLVLIFKPLS